MSEMIALYRKLYDYALTSQKLTVYLFHTEKNVLIIDEDVILA